MEATGGLQAGSLAPFGSTGGAGASSGSADFAALLRRQGLYPAAAATHAAAAATHAAVGATHAAVAPAMGRPEETHATTILAFKFADGVLMAGDRRATAGNTVVYDRADKVLEIDRHSLMAIAGVPATAWEMARMLEHSFQFYRRTQLQEMSLDGKVRALSKLLRDNFGFVMQGVGIVVPIFATYDTAAASARLYFYDAMGAQFEAADYAVSGSGSPAVRSILYYANTWGPKPLREISREEAVVLALRALDTAAETDTATGGVDRRGLVYPVVKIVSGEGILTLSEEDLAKTFKTEVR